MNHTATGKTGGFKEAVERGVVVIDIYSPDRRGHDTEAGLRESWKEQTRFCKAEGTLTHMRTRVGPITRIVM